MRRIVPGLLCLAVLAIPAPAFGGSARNTHEDWARGAIALVTNRGVFPGSPAQFRPTEPLTQSSLDDALGRLGAGSSGPAAGDAPVSIAALDAQVIDALGLRRAARDFYTGAWRAGLKPPARFGTEVVARLLGLRTDLPVADDSLELQPQQAATRADAAYSLARVLTLGEEPGPSAPVSGASALLTAEAGGGVQYVKGLAATFDLPRLSPWQRQVIQTAVTFIGFPYVWGGEDEKTEHGFDCSGFVWRVFKLTNYPGAADLSTVFGGRTAADMAGEVAKAERIKRADLEPGDVLFFGHGPHSKPAQIDHAAIYLGNGWLIQSSGQGVALALLDWNGRGFAWGRRPLAEAGLEPATATTAA